MTSKSKRILGTSIAAAMLVILFLVLKRPGGDVSGVSSRDPGSRATSTATGASFSPDAKEARNGTRDKERRTDEEIAREFHAAYRNVLDSDDPFAVRQGKLEALAKNFVEQVGIRKALADLDTFLGPGRDRNLLLAHFYSNALESQTELIGLARSSPSKEAQELAFGGLSEKMIRKGIDPEVLKDLFPLREGETKNFAFLLSGLLKWQGDASRPAYKLDDSLALLKQAYPDKGAYATQLKDFLSLMHGYLPFDVWEKCGPTLLENPATKEFAITHLTAGLIGANPSKGLSTLLEFDARNPGTIPPSKYSDLIVIFYRRDANEALKWYNENSASMPKAVREQMAFAFAGENIGSGSIEEANRWIAEIDDKELQKKLHPRVAVKLIKDGDFSNAWDYVGKIEDPALKKQAEGRVWAEEQKAVRATVNSNPVEAMNALISGSSRHGTYWIEEAMGTWLGKDFDGARDWFVENWESMPIEKAQYGAAAFATKAAEMGDIETASQWVAYIKDPKTRSRVEARIAKSAKKGQ